MVGAAVAVGVGTVASSVISGQGARSAGRTQARAARDAAELQQERYEQTRADLQPYNEFGQGRLPQLNELLGGSGSDPARILRALEGLPGYQFTLQQGLRSVQNSAAARGLGSSGAALRGAADYTTGLAQANYTNFFNNLLAGATLGQNAAAQTGSIGAGLAQNAGNNLVEAGRASAAGQLGFTNALAGGINNLGNIYLTSRLPGFNGGGGAGGGGGIAPFGYSSSDRRLKENIEKLGTLNNGLDWYRYNFIGDEEVCEGVLADEVEKVIPEAVVLGEDGFLYVNYDLVLSNA